MQPKKLNSGDDSKAKQRAARKHQQETSKNLLYQSIDGQTKIEVKLENETVWLTQEQMAELCQKSQSTINEHIQNIYKEDELVETETLRKFGISENSFSNPTNCYNPDMIISVGYRVKLHRGTQFHIWATRRLKEYLVKGFVMDDQRLAKGKTTTGVNYFQELLKKRSH